jgi:hypothetical protein
VGRAQLNRNLAIGSVRITDILATPPECAKTQKVRDLLLAPPKYGPVRAARLLTHRGISASEDRGRPQRPPA